MIIFLLEIFLFVLTSKNLTFKYYVGHSVGYPYKLFVGEVKSQHKIDIKPTIREFILFGVGILFPRSPKRFFTSPTARMGS